MLAVDATALAVGFNGAACRSTRRVAMLTKRPLLTLGLQRSRVPEHAESPSAASAQNREPTGFNGAACRSTRRGRRIKGRKSPPGCASTEPRAGARGEMDSRRPSTSAVRCFNGAACRSTRREGTQVTQFERGLPLQRSRVPEHAERRRAPTRPASPRCFNGAACRSTRRDPYFDECQRCGKSLQRSRVPEHAESFVESVICHPMLASFNGAACRSTRRARRGCGTMPGPGASTEPRAGARGEFSNVLAAPRRAPRFNGAACRSTRRGGSLSCRR